MSAPPHGSDGTRAPSRTVAPTDPDFALLLRIKEGEADAFTPLSKKYEPSLFGLFLDATGDRQEAEDLTIEALSAAFIGIPSFRGSGTDPQTGVSVSCTFCTYLHTIARNMLKRWIRRKGKRDARIEDIVVSASGDSDTGLDAIGAHALDTDGLTRDPLIGVLDSERTDETCFAVASVPSSSQFKALLLHYGAGMKHQEIAAILDTRGETINSRLQDGRKALKRQIAQRDESPDSRGQ
jgi:RNA polymerase sigma-70 factor, ECF subfamily